MFAERTGSLTGTMLGKDYRVLEPIGAGGMAVVYLVEHQTLLKRFAAKVLSPELASSMEARARFTQEAHAASQLDHENIVSISDFGVTADQRPFFVMERLRGQTLDQRLNDGPMTIEEVVAVCVPVARALAHAHAEGIIHRDIKPENIFLVQRSQGRWGVKVVDFGIAKTPLHPKLTQLKLGETLGSPPFMAPEMIRGEEELVDPRTDVYSFGVLLYLMLCGRLPFDDDNLLKVMQMHLVAPVPPPREVNPALAPELAAVVERALAKRREDRYPSMDALLLELEVALARIDAPRPHAQSRPPANVVLSNAPRARAQSLPPSNVVLSVAPRPSRAPVVLAVGAAALALIGVLGTLGWRGGLAGHSTAASEPEAPPPEPPAPRADVSAAPVARGEPGESAPVHPEVPRELPHTAPRAAALGSRGPQTSKPTRRTRLDAATHPNVHVSSHVLVAATDPARGSGWATVAAGGSAAGEPQDHAGSSPPLPAPSAAPPHTPPVSVPIVAEASLPVPGSPAPAAATPRIAAGLVRAASFDATPQVASFEVTGSLSPSVVRRSVERVLPALRACYGAAARAGRATPAIDLTLRFEIDENSAAVHVAVASSHLDSLARCAAGVASQIRTTEAPDVGTVKVTSIIHFHPS